VCVVRDFKNLVEVITEIIKQYRDTVREMPCVPTTSFRRDCLGSPGDVNKLFLTFLNSEYAIGVQFLKDAVVILSKVQCNHCGRDMTWYADSSVIYRSFQMAMSKEGSWNHIQERPQKGSCKMAASAAIRISHVSELFLHGSVAGSGNCWAGCVTSHVC
jgi:hypothetical protein